MMMLTASAGSVPATGCRAPVRGVNGESDASRCVLAARLPIGATRALLSTSLADDPLEDGARVEYARSRTISIIDSIGFVKNAVFGGGPRTPSLVPAADCQGFERIRRYA